MAIALAGNRARGVRRSQQRLGVDVVGIGGAGFLAGNRAHAHTLFDRMRAVPDDAVLDRPGLAPRMLEIQVAAIDAGAEPRTEGASPPGRTSASGPPPTGLAERRPWAGIRS